jgi:carboxymethylenebutenolidase
MQRYQTNMYEGMLAETTSMRGHNSLLVKAYFARPIGPGPFPGMLLIPHNPGWDELYREFTRRFAHHGYLAICPNIFHDFGNGVPEDIAAKARAAGGPSDDDVVADSQGVIDFLKSLSQSSAKIGVFGTCSGGRNAFLVACRAKGVDAAIECWGGGVVMSQADLNQKKPVAPIDYTKDLSCPLLGLFGNEDKNPNPEQVNLHEQELKKYGKNYEFHRYPGAGHGFFYYDRPMYRQEQAVDGWSKIWEFLDKNLGGGTTS